MAFGFGRKGHGKRHDMSNAKDHEGDWYDALDNTPNAIDAANPLADKKYVDDEILAALKGLDWQESVLSRYDPTGGLPVAPSVGDRYIATATANGWTDEHIYECVTNGTWTGATDTAPNEGFCCEVEDENLYYIYITSWVKFSSVIDHAVLQNLNWSTAAHVIDEDIDMATHGLKNVKRPKVDYEVSNKQGDDTNGDGGLNNPYKTMQKAIDVYHNAGGGGISEMAVIRLDSDSLVPYFGVIPGQVAAVENISITAPEAFLQEQGIAVVSSLEIEYTNAVEIDNLLVQKLKEGSSSSGVFVWIEECWIQQLLNYAEDSHPANMTIFFEGTLLSQAAFDNAIAMGSRAHGRAKNKDTNQLINFDELNMNAKKIVNVADPTASQHADTKAARDSAITTHSGLPNVHHTPPTTLPPSGAAGGQLGGTYPDPTVDDGADGSAIHDDVAGEIAAIAALTDPDDDDLLLLEDDGASNAKKKMTIANLMKWFEPNSYVSEGLSSTTSGTFQNKIDQTPTLPAGEYIIDWYAEIWTSSSGSSQRRMECAVDIAASEAGRRYAWAYSYDEGSSQQVYGHFSGHKRITHS